MAKNFVCYPLKYEYWLNKIKRQEKKGDSYQSQGEVNIEHIMA